MSDHTITNSQSVNNGEKASKKTAANDGSRTAQPGFNRGEFDINVPLDQVDTSYAASLDVSRLKGRSLNAMVTVVSGVGFTLFGYDQGVMGGLLTLPSFEAAFPQTAGIFGGSSSHNATLQSLLVAIYELGCMAGALSNLWIGDRIGRRKTITLGGIIMIIGAILQTAAQDYAMMLVARVITGVGNGLLTSTVPAYQSECAEPHRRGQLVLVEGSLITFGVMTSYWVDLGFYFTSGSISWRFPIALQILFALFMIAAMWGFRLPESPRWLVAKGKHAESLAVLAALAGTSVDDKKVLQTWHGICNAVALETEGGFKFANLTTHGKGQNFRRTLLGVLAQCFQQISGINLITYYLNSVLESIGLDAELSRIISGVNGTCYFLTSIIAIFIIERVGRRPLMLWTAAAQCATMAVLAGLYNVNNHAAQVVSVLCLFLFNTWFSIGWLGMTWLYPAEVTPLGIRAPANALSTASNWIFNFMVVMATGPMFANIGLGTYALFAALNGLIIFPVVYLFFPETKKYSLEELDLIFALAYETGESPVKVSKTGNIPEAGSAEADQILGREVNRPGVGQRKGSRLGRMLSREKTTEITHRERMSTPANPIILITGANTGVGFATVQALLKSPTAYTILLTSRSLARSQKAVEDLKAAGQTHSELVAVELDIEDDESIKMLYEKVEKDYGRIDVLHNNAGGYYIVNGQLNNSGANFDFDAKKGKMTAREAWSRAYNLNATSTHIFTETMMPLLFKSDNRRLIFVTSEVGSITQTKTRPDVFINKAAPAGWPKTDPMTLGFPAYRASKAGTNMVARHWCRVLENDNVKINLLCPGLTATNFAGNTPEQNAKIGGAPPEEAGEFMKEAIEGKYDDHLGEIVSGFAELISGAISMGIGGYLSAKGEQDIFRHRLSAISKRLGNACEPEVQREIHNVLGPFGVNPSLSRLVAKNLQIIEHEEAIKQDLPDEPQARTAQFLAAGFLGWPLRVATRLTAPTRGTAAFLIQLGEGMREVSNMRLYVSAMTIGLSYFVGGLIPIIPYLCVPDALHGLYWSIVSTRDDRGKAWFTGAAKGAWGLAWGAISMLGVGGAAAAASFGVVKALARSQA
ncbi:vacuolar iron transporter family protein, partial [Tremellales sp. Uapishka_1]